MRIAVFGSGGVGGYFGARLAQAGLDVSFIARGAHLEAIKNQGLQIISPKGDVTVTGLHATDDPSAVSDIDVVIVATKAWQVPEAARLIAPMLAKNGFVLPLQNGVEAPEHLSASLGTSRVLGGMCGILAWIDSPGVIRHVGIEPVVRFSELDNQPSQRCQDLLNAFAAAQGLEAEIPADIHVTMWQKFVFIASASGVGAVTRVPFGEFRSLPESRQLLEAAMREIVAVGQARGVALPDSAVKTALQTADKTPADGTASMQRDILAGRPSELEAQNGAVVRLSEGTGVDVPVNRFIYASLLAQERAARRA